MKKLIFTLLLTLLSTSAMAQEIAGVKIAEEVSTSNGRSLTLNGAGIRSKLFFKIYIAQLYLAESSSSAEAILQADSPKRLVMHFLYDEVSREKLVDGWNSGFHANLTAETMVSLQGKIDQFNALFQTVHSGDVISLDYQPGLGTRVIISGTEKGVVAGKDFNDALLSIWLGKSPVTKDLKKQLLSQNR